MRFRKARLKDFEKLYQLGLDTPELKVSNTNVFIDPEEFKFCIKYKYGIFLLAEEKNKLAGFIYAEATDIKMRYPKKWGSINYLVVHPNFRNKGVASVLFDECVEKLIRLGVSNLYSWANSESGIVDFFGKKGLVKGHVYIWMDKLL